MDKNETWLAGHWFLGLTDPGRSPVRLWAGGFFYYICSNLQFKANINNSSRFESSAIQLILLPISTTSIFCFSKIVGSAALRAAWAGRGDFSFPLRESSQSLLKLTWSFAAREKKNSYSNIINSSRIEQFNSAILIPRLTHFKFLFPRSWSCRELCSRVWVRGFFLFYLQNR